MIKALSLTGIAIFLIVCAGVVIYFELRMYADAPANANDTQKVLVNVRQGQTLKATAALLYQKSIICYNQKHLLI